MMKACDECVLFNTDACPMGCVFRDKPCEDFLSVESEVGMRKDEFPIVDKLVKDSINDVLDKIRAEIHATAEMHEDGDYYLRDEWIDEIIDKYRKEKPDV